MNAPLPHYFIYTGHNSYLTGNQLSSDSSDAPIIEALQRGVRVIELDLWPNSTEDDVDVLHGMYGVSVHYHWTLIFILFQHMTLQDTKWPSITVCHILYCFFAYSFHWIRLYFIKIQKKKWSNSRLLAVLQPLDITLLKRYILIFWRTLSTLPCLHVWVHCS